MYIRVHNKNQYDSTFGFFKNNSFSFNLGIVSSVSEIDSSIYLKINKP